jgi:hypothetical protein
LGTKGARVQKPRRGCGGTGALYFEKAHGLVEGGELAPGPEEAPDHHHRRGAQQSFVGNSHERV